MLDPSKYDMKLRPNFGGTVDMMVKKRTVVKVYHCFTGEPTTITIEINIRSMGPVSEIDSVRPTHCH